MHDGVSFTFLDAILRHRGEADQARHRFEMLSPKQKEDLFQFLRSL